MGGISQLPKFRQAAIGRREAMTTREIVEKIMAAKPLSGDDARARELIHKTVLGSLNRATDTIERTQLAGSVAWRVI